MCRNGSIRRAWYSLLLLGLLLVGPFGAAAQQTSENLSESLTSLDEILTRAARLQKEQQLSLQQHVMRIESLETLSAEQRIALESLRNENERLQALSNRLGRNLNELSTEVTTLQNSLESQSILFEDYRTQSEQTINRLDRQVRNRWLWIGAAAVGGLVTGGLAF